MTLTKMSNQQISSFNELVTKLNESLGGSYCVQQGSFMDRGLQYAETSFFPTNQQKTRSAVCNDVEVAVRSMGHNVHHAKNGKGVYMTDEYVVGDITIIVANARKGGKVICFSC